MNLTSHFTMDEMTFSETATRHHIDNTPSQDIIDNLQQLAFRLERVREILGRPLFISSAYRSPKVNAAVGGSKTSAHMQGLAADFTCPSWGTPKEIVKELEQHVSLLAYDQIINEGRWIHLGIAPAEKTPRRQILTAHFGPNGVSYTAGV